MKRLLFLLLMLPAFSRGQVITTYAGAAGHSFAGDGGPATDASFDFPDNVAADRQGNIFVADFWNARIRRVDAATGIITTIAGNGHFVNTGNGGPATDAGINSPTGVAIDRQGNIYITCDSITNAGTTSYFDQGTFVRKVSATGIITTIAGNGSAVYGGDNGPATAAGIGQANSISVDSAGNIYIAELASRIRKIDTAGMITTIAGTGVSGYAGDGGPATAALIWGAGDVVPDNSGNIYFTDGGRVRKIDATGLVHTIAGNGSFAWSGDGGPATAAGIGHAFGLALDDSGNVIFSDLINAVVRKIDTAGIITTIAGNGVMGNSGDGGAPDSAEITSVYGVATDSLGNIYLSDVQNENIRMICTRCIPAGTSVINPVPSALTIRPLAGYSAFSILLTTNSPGAAKLVVTSVNGEKIKETSCVPGKDLLLTLDVPPGVYIVTAITGQQQMSGKIVVR